MWHKILKWQQYNCSHYSATRVKLQMACLDCVTSHHLLTKSKDISTHNVHY